MDVLSLKTPSSEYISLCLVFLDGEEIRTTKGEFGESNVHDQSGISFRTPPYPDPDITEPVKVC